jgi:RHS repeat-associated protein
VYYCSSDTLHSEVVVTDQNRNVVERTYYAPYGAVLNRDLRDGPGYTGHEEDPETNLVYMQQRYYDSEVGRFLSTDPVQADGGGGSFNRYAYANDNPYRYTDPDGRDVTEFIGGLFVETAHLVTGQGFNGSNLVGALKDGYNGEGGGVLHAVVQDASTLSVVAGGVGALKGVASLAVRQTGEEVVANLARGAVQDDVKGAVRQIVKTGGEKQFRSDTAAAMKGAKVKTVETDRGPVQVGTHSDGSTVSARSFSSSGRPTIQVEQPKVEITTKVRYDKDQQ